MASILLFIQTVTSIYLTNNGGGVLTDDSGNNLLPI